MDVIPLPPSLDPQAGDAFVQGASQLPVVSQGEPSEPIDAWTERFHQAIQLQHHRVRLFVDVQRERWKQIEALLDGKIHLLSSEIRSLRETNEDLRRRLVEASLQADARQDDLNHDCGDETVEIHELRARNAELLRQLAQVHSHPRGSEAPAHAFSDWETEKLRILAALESDVPQEDAVPRRMQIEEIVERTNHVVVEKDREIAELQHLLKTQSDSLGSVAVGASAVEQWFDQDAVIREQRERLKQIQDEWRQKLREAEIEISMERAKIARQHSEIEEKLRFLEASSCVVDASRDALCPTGRPVRGRWLARLGLTDADGRMREDEE
jgi:hypothetical protein